MKLITLVEIYIYLTSFTSSSQHHLVFYENQTFLTINEKKKQLKITSVLNIFFWNEDLWKEKFLKMAHWNGEIYVKFGHKFIDNFANPLKGLITYLTLILSFFGYVI